MTVWVTGSAGMLGTEVVASLQHAGLTVLATDREVDITDKHVVSDYWDAADGIDWVVNCAAYTAVDKAEQEEEAAMRLNSLGPEVLAHEANRRSASLVHISTDYVFDGRSDRPYLPDDEPNPQSAYGRTKLGGERAVSRALVRHVVVRTAWLYGPAGKNFVYTMLRLMRERDAINVVSDQRGAPTYAPDLAGAILSIITHSRPSYGTYHFTNSGETSWHGFAERIYEEARRLALVETDCAINPIGTDQYPTPAKRPAYSVLDLSLIEDAFGVRAPLWQDGLERFLEHLAGDQELSRSRAE